MIKDLSILLTPIVPHFVKNCKRPLKFMKVCPLRTSSSSCSQGANPVDFGRNLDKISAYIQQTIISLKLEKSHVP